MKLCGFDVGLDKPFFLIAGPCVIESREMALETAAALKDICAELAIPFIYKSSYDKANRSSGQSFRGMGMEKGLEILAEVRERVGVPVLTDVHTEAEVPHVAAVVDVLQTPAFLCRQTDFIHAVASCGKPVNIKKGQFLAPWDMTHVVAKAKATGNQEEGFVQTNIETAEFHGDSFQLPCWWARAALTKAVKSGWPLRGLEVNSGWNWQPTNHGCTSCGSSIISHRSVPGARPETRRPWASSWDSRVLLTS